MEKEGTLSLNKEGRIIRFSSALTGILGYLHDEVMGGTLRMFAPAQKYEEYKALFDTAKEAGPVVGHKTEVLRKDGTVIDVFVSIYPLRDRTGALDSIMFTVKTERSSEMPAILTDEFQRIFKFSNDAVTITDKDACIIDVNKSFLDTYGYSKDEVLGKNPRLLQSEHSTIKLYEKMWEDLLNPDKGYWRGEIINLRKDGREVPVLLSINAMKDAGGEVRNFLGIAFNMTKQKELDRVNMMYIDYIMHDIKGPLTIVSLNADRLIREVGDNIPEKSRKRIGAILESSHRVENMAVDVLNFSRAQSGALPLDKRVVRAFDVLRAAVEPFENSGKEIFVNDKPLAGSFDDGAELVADPEKLERILYNLLSNAVKHSKNEVRIKCCVKNSRFEFSVYDDGGGISKEDADRVFDAFYQTEEGIKTGGAGLGLSIVKTFVEAHGGRVWVLPGEGATFGFFIPSDKDV